MKSFEEKRFGFHSIQALLKNKPHKIKKIFLPEKRSDSRIEDLIKLIDENGINYELSKKIKQDPVAIMQKEERLSFQALKNFVSKAKNNNLLILILDNIIDPRNIGSCLRSAAVLEVDAVIINKHKCGPLNEVAHNVSAGGSDFLNIYHVSNLVNCIKFLKENDIEIFGLSEHAEKIHTDTKFSNSSAIIMGSEQNGLRQKTIENCDYLLKLGNNKTFKSFNVSVATGIILTEIVRQRNSEND